MKDLEECMPTFYSHDIIEPNYAQPRYGREYTTDYLDLNN
jgi:hypothetical protein